jgi:hypothetical protein
LGYKSYASRGYLETELKRPVAFCAATDLGPVLASIGRQRDDHQVPIEMLQDLDLGALSILPQRRIQPTRT